jgi:Ceramidase
MKRSHRLFLLASVSLLAVVVVLSLGHIPQANSYHHFCDTRTVWGIPSFANVVSNLPFVVIGIGGLMALRGSLVRGSIGASYLFLFLGIVFTGVGSAYYHLSPNNETLVWDRLPMTIVFMSLLAAVAGESIGSRAAALALAPLLLAGAGSIWWWHHTEQAGQGDLRPYVLVQYYPVLLIPAILLLFPSAAGRRDWPPLLGAIGWYAVAKIFDQLDCAIYSFGGLVSGHTLKHLAAAMSTWLLLKRFRVMHGGAVGRGES